MREEIILNSKKFLSLKTAARETNYTNDYIGQLCRSGKINSQMVGKIRFVEEDSLLEYVKKANGFVDIKYADIENIAIKNNKDLGDFSSVRDTDFAHFRQDKANSLYVNIFETVFSKKVVHVYIAILVLCGLFFGSTLDIQGGFAKIKNKSAEGLAKIVMGAKVASDKISETTLAVANGEIDYEKVYKNYSNFLGEMSVDFAEGEVKYFKNVTGVGSKVTEAIFNPSDTFVTVKTETKKIQGSVEEIIFGGVIYFENLSTNLIRVNEKISQNGFAQEKNLALLSQDSFGFTEKFAITWYRTISGFFSSAEKIADSTDEADSGQLTTNSTDEDDSSVFASDSEVIQEEDEANSQQPTANSTNQNTTIVTNPIREIIKETVVERVIQTSGVTLEDLQKLNNELRSEIYKLSSNTNAQITNTYQVISATNNIDNLGSVTITDSNISSSNVSGTELSFTNGTIQNLTVTGTATSTYGGPISATSGTYSGNLTVTGNTTLNTLTVSGDTIFDTDTLYIDSINNRVGIGSTTPTDTLSINGATYLAPISAPSITTDRLYNISNDLYWGGNLLSGSAVGNWTSNGTDVWRASGNVGIGTSSPSSDYRLSVQGNTYIKGNLRVNGNTTISDSGELTVGDKVISEGEIGVGTSSPYAKLSIQGTTVSTTTFGIYGFANQTQSLFDVYDNPTNNLNVFRITSDGSVGIATSSPFRKLSVEGSAWISGDLTANSFTATSSMSAPYFTATDSSATSTFAGGLAVGTNKFVVDYSTGNVGVGTVSPDQKLDVNGWGRFEGAGSTNRSDSGAIEFYNNNASSLNVQAQIKGLRGIGSYNSGQLGFFTRLAGTLYERMTLDENGNVGIGTMVPGYKLDIAGSVAAPTTLLVQAGGITENTGNAFRVYRNRASSSTNAPLVDFINDAATDDQPLFRLQQDAPADILQVFDGATQVFTILDGGNVGIGTTSPLAKLSVKGAGTTTGINFQTTNSADTPLVTVLDSGNVGIGTVSPGAKLEVFGDMIIGDVTNGSVFRYNPTTNTIVNGAHENSIGVGSSNSIIAAGGATASSNINSIGTDSYVTTISGGYDNTIGNDSPAATISGGAHHRIDTGGTHGTIGGGSTNTIQAGGDYGFIGAGLSNIVGGTYAFIGAGSNNVATGFRSAVMGGYSNDATGQYATIPGGWGNAASGDYSFAFGYRANAAATGVVVFKDSVNAQYTVNTTNMFGANFTGGYQLLGGNVGIGTTSPFAKLSVKGAGTTTGVNFQTTNSADTPLVTVLDSGNVGIGTTNPGAMLELSSISINGSVLRLSNNNNTIAQGEELGSIEFFSGDNSGSYPDTVKAKILSLTEDSVSRDGNLVFKTSLLSDASPVERMRINSNGNVGIGSTSPFAKLSVKGAGTTTGINFQTTNSANTPLVTVLDSGNVGIGTTAPSEKLEVAGNILLWNSVNDNTLRFKDNNVAHGLTDLVSTYIHTELRNEDVSAGGTRLLGVTDQDLASGINLYGVLGVTDPTDTVPAIKINGAKKNTTNVQSLGNLETVFQVQNNTSPLLTLLGNGNLGIGTTSPFAKLSVVGDVVADYFNATSTTATSTFAGGLTVGTNKLVVDRSTGNVGIGTASPSQMLSVGASSQFTVTSAGVVTGQNFAVTSGAYVIDVSNGLRLYSNGGLGIKFTTWDGSYVDRMVVSTTGNIGIGTTSPFAKLSVTGTGTGTGSAFQVADSANSPKFTVLDNGNVGVGTVSPTQKLDVNGNIHLGSSVDDLTTRNIYLASNRYLSLTSTGLDVSNWYGSDGSAHKVGFNGKEVLVVGSNGIVAIGNNINGGPGDYMPLVLQGNESGDVLIKSDQYQWGVDTRPIRIITDDPYANTGQTLNAGNIVLQTGIGTNGGATGIIKFEIGASGSEKMRIDTSGNIGIGTTTPWRTLSVNGTAAFTGLTNDGTGYYACISTNGELATSTTACGASSERFKTNINDLTYGLDTVLQLRPVSFNWKSDFINSSSTQIGFIAEEVDLLIPEVIGHDDKGNIMNLDYPKLTAVLVGAMKELNTKISAIASSTPIVSTGIVDSVLSHLESLGAKFVDGIAYFKDVVVKTLTAEKVITNGIEMVDEVTGEIYCVRIQNGAMVNIAGTCDTANSQQPTAEPSNTTPPTITITGNNPAVVEINSNYIDLGATAVDYQGNSLIVDTIDADTVDTTTAGEYTVTYTTFDGTLTSTSTRTVLVEDSTAVTTEPATTTEPTATTTNPVVEPTATTTDPVVEPTATTTEQI